MRAAILVLLLAATAHADRDAPPFTPPWAAAQLRTLPTDGPPGTELTIRGATFHKYVRVFYGDVPMRVLRASAHEIVAVIPSDARRDDYIYVVDGTGRARTIDPFDVWAAPHGARRFHNEPPSLRCEDPARCPRGRR